MQKSIDTEWDGAGFGGNPLSGESQNLGSWRWSFAWLPDEKMKAVAAGWMTRVMMGADPAEMSAEELQVLSISLFMATDRRVSGERALLCDA